MEGVLKKAAPTGKGNAGEIVNGYLAASGEGKKERKGKRGEDIKGREPAARF